MLTFTMKIFMVLFTGFYSCRWKPQKVEEGVFVVSPTSNTRTGLVKDVVANTTCPVPDFLTIFKDFKMEMHETINCLMEKVSGALENQSL